jgi:hypothetical protein
MAVDLQAQILVLRTSVDASLGARRDPSAAGLGTAGLGEKPAEGVQIPWRAGERLTGTVETLLPNGRFHLRVGDFVFNVAMPQRLSIGERLDLEYVSASPRPTFALIQPPEAPQSASPQSVEISPSARALTNLIQSLAPDKVTQRIPAGATTPVLPNPPVDAAPLAAALQQALDRSGLFYESHLAQWTVGQRPLEYLLQEPQGRLSVPNPSNSTGPSQAAEEHRLQALPSPSETKQPTPGLSKDIVRVDANDPVHPQTIQQVRSQIDALETRQILWQGQAWPGQPIQWRIEEPPERETVSAEPLPWTTQVRLTLPRLGEVTADLTLIAQALRLRLRAGSADTQAALGQGQGPLASALQQAGLQLAAFQVSSDESA